MSKSGLIADIGATNARFAVADAAGIQNELVLPCADFPGLEDAMKAYLEQTGQQNCPSLAAVAVAAPITEDKIVMTNHPWSFSVSDTKASMGFERFDVINDFEAVAMSIPFLGDSGREQIGSGEAVADAPIGVIGPGTGLGVAYLVHNGRRYRAYACEGGHVTMPAKTQRELDIFNALISMKYSHVSAERVCSGKGLENLYNAICKLDGRDDLPLRTPEEISSVALAKECEVCAECLTLMTAFLGRVAGNLALTLGAHGGIYIAGGIVLKLGEYFDQSSFREEFSSKGRFKDYMAAIPTFVITNKFPALLGLQADLMAE